jgi:hypothetical protein
MWEENEQKHVERKEHNSTAACQFDKLCEM